MTSRRLVALALFAVLALKIAVFVQLGHHPLLTPAGETDGAYYQHFAQMVAGGDTWLTGAPSFFGQAPAAFPLSPLYIYFLAACLSVPGGSLETARIAQLALGTAGVLLLGLVTRRWFGERAAWISGGLAALCGVFTFYELLILPTALDPFLTAVDLYLLATAAEDGGTKRWAMAGAALGLHALNSPGMLIVLAGLVVIAAIRSYGRRPVAAFLLAALIVIAPVTLRNYRLAGQFVLITSNLGLSVLAGNGPDADGTFARVGDIVPNVSGRWLTAPQSWTFLKRSLAWMRDHPLAEVKLLAAKTWYASSATFLAINHSFPFFARDIKGSLTLLAVGPALIIPLGVIGLLFCRPRGRRGYWVWAAYVPLAILPMLFTFVSSRDRVPYQMALAAGAGAAVSYLIDRVRERAWRSLAKTALAFALVAAVVVWPTRLDDGRTEETTRMGLVELQNSRVAEGEAWVQRALARQAPPGVLHVRVGQVYETLSRPAEAITHYRQALTTDPKEPAIHFVLGRALFASGDLSGAIRELAGARVGPQQDTASRLLVIALAKSNRVEETNAVIRDLDPNRWNADQARQFAAAIAEAGRVDLSIAAWQRAAELGRTARDYERLGLAWAMVGRANESLAALAEAVKRDNTVASIRQNYGSALATVGRFTEARAEAEAALRIDPNHENAKRLLEAIKGK